MEAAASGQPCSSAPAAGALKACTASLLDWEERGLQGGLDGYLVIDRQKQTYKFRYRTFEDDRGLPLPPCHLSEEEQLIELSQAYKRIQRFLPPPFSEKELRALERRFKNRFPLLLRHYLLNISRELIIRTGYDESKIHSIWSILEIAEFPWKEFWEEAYENSRWCLPDSMMGEDSDEGFYTAICLKGDAAGFAYQWLDDEPFTPCLLSLYNVLMPRFVSEAWLEQMLEYETAAIRIQKHFRLWQWRKAMVFNPHTEIGRLNLMIKFRVLTKTAGTY